VLRFREGRAAVPFRVAAPVRMSVEFVFTRHADRAYLIPGTERLSGTRLEYTAPDMLIAHRAFRALATIARD
jgi:D-aminopeptidase